MNEFIEQARKRVKKRLLTNAQLQRQVSTKESSSRIGSYTVNEYSGSSIVKLLTSNRSNAETCTILTSKAKLLFQKSDKAPHELEYLQKFTTNMKCFQQYSSLIRQQLAGVLLYQLFDKGHVLVHHSNNDLPNYLYFIVSGCVHIAIEHDEQYHTIRQLRTGESFGQPNLLLHGLKQKTTIICIEETECLTVDKDSFDEVLRLTHEIEWMALLSTLRNHWLFHNWNDADIIKTAEGSMFIEYLPNSVIVKDLSAFHDYVYLLISGTCKVIEKLKMKEQYDFQQRKRHLVLPSLSKHGIIRGKTLRKWVTIHKIEPGEMFGIGEGRADTCVISEQLVKCLAINRFALFKYDVTKSVATFHKDLADVYPSRSVVFKKYIEQCQWTEYKKQVLFDIVSKEGTCCSSSSNCSIYKTVGKCL